MMYEDYGQIVKSKKGGEPATQEITQREEDLKDELAQSRQDFKEQSERQSKAFESRLGELQEQSQAQLRAVERTFGQQISAAESARSALAQQNASLSQRLSAQAVGARSGNEATKVSPSEIFTGLRRGRGRSSNILASGNQVRNASNTLGSRIQL